MRTFLPRLLLISLLWALPFAARADLALGEQVPAFDTTLLDGSIVEAKVLAGRPLLVVFWATWCPICRRELPKLQQLYDAHKTAGFEIVGLSIDNEHDEVELFQQEHRYTFPIGMRTAKHSATFDHVRLPPRFYLIDRSGKLVWKHVGAIRDDRLEAALKLLL